MTGLTSGSGFGISRQLICAGAGVMLNGFVGVNGTEKIRAAMEFNRSVHVGYSGLDMSDCNPVCELIAKKFLYL